MLYVLAILLPPVALLLCGKPFQALASVVLHATIVGWLPASIWALFVVNNHYAEQREKKLLSEMRRHA